ncbi:MAG TPA: PaaI family thioesterase [Acidimicrobiales bacterium]|nr:PaaI family thioesterase [Acidimicrobiales bacterium]
MNNEEHRVGVASLLRELGHEFVARELSDDVLDALDFGVRELLNTVRDNPRRQRSVPLEALTDFKLAAPAEGRVAHHLFADSVVSGGANPMGLGAELWREGDTAVMEVTLGRAFEGAPGRSHGGIVAALIDETMGMVMGIHDAIGFTAQLDITYLAPVPIGEPITARARLEHREGRKMTSHATVSAKDVVLAEASALFITVDPQQFLAHLLEQ